MFVNYWKDEVPLDHTVNCKCQCLRVCACALGNKCLCMCAIIQNRQSKTLKQSQKRSNLAIALCVRRNDRQSRDKRFLVLWSSGQHSFLSTSTCDPHLPFSVHMLSSSGWIFYRLPNVSVPHPCSSAVGSACRVVWLSLRCLPKVSISSRWL